MILKISQNLQESTSIRVSFKVVDLRSETLLKKKLRLRFFPLNFEEFLRIAYFIENLRWLLLTFAKFLMKKIHVVTRLREHQYHKFLSCIIMRNQLSRLCHLEKKFVLITAESMKSNSGVSRKYNS